MRESQDTPPPAAPDPRVVEILSRADRPRAVLARVGPVWEPAGCVAVGGMEESRAVEMAQAPSAHGGRVLLRTSDAVGRLQADMALVAMEEEPALDLLADLLLAHLERALLQKQQQSLMLEATGLPGGRLIVSLPDGQVRKADRGAGRVLGRDPDALTGTPVVELGVLPSATWSTIIAEIDRAALPWGVAETAAGRPIAYLAGRSLAWPRQAPTLDLDILDRGLTERMATAFQERERLASLGEQTSASAHEINNVVGSTLSLIQLLQHPGLDNRERNLHMQNLQQEAMRAARLVGQLLGLSRQWQEEPTHFDLVDVAADLITLKTRTLESQGIRISLHRHVETCPVRARRAQIEQVLLQVMGNAADAYRRHEQGGDIEVRIERPLEGEARLTVEDHAGGLDADLAPVAFEPFVTGHPAEPHAGLGLHIARELARENGGTLTLENHPATGVLVTLALPLAPSAPNLDTDTQATSPKPRFRDYETMRRVQGLAILLVDDEPILRATTARTLRLYGPRLVTEAATAEEAIGAIEEDPSLYDVIILDMRLPDHNGRWVLEQIEDCWPSLARRVVFVMGERIEGSLLEFLEEKMVPYITKPYLERDLVNLVVEVAGEAVSR